MREIKPRIDQEMSIGEVLKKYPQSRRIFQKHFGQDCFNCPGSRLETIQFGALMHNKDVHALLKDLNSKLK